VRSALARARKSAEFEVCGLYVGFRAVIGKGTIARDRADADKSRARGNMLSIMSGKPPPDTPH
jgi:hypothetical protein